MFCHQKRGSSLSLACTSAFHAESEIKAHAGNVRLQSSGFNLIEVSVVIAIVAILVSVAMPSFSLLVTETRLTGEINALNSALNFSRSEAVKRGQMVSVCPISGTSCNTTTNWTAGWQVLLNDATSKQLLISPGVTHGGVLNSTLASYPQFTPTGYTFYTGTISLRDSSNTPSLYRCIVFNAGSWVTKTGAICP